MFLNVDGTMLVQLLNFAVFFAILRVVFLRPVSRAITARREYINGVTADFDRYQAEARERREHAERIRGEARRDAEQTLAKARAEASNDAAELSAQYAQRASETIEGAQRSVDGELQSARANEAQLVRQLADSMVERALEVVA
jgi:F-type H+-transporting ATPase subunit b